MLQSTYCDTLYQHCQSIGRSIHLVNLGVQRTAAGHPSCTHLNMPAAAQHQQAGRHSQTSQTARLLISILLVPCTILARRPWRCPGAITCTSLPLPAAPKPDPAAESFSYPVSCDVRDLVTLEDVMEELQLGPNG